MVPSKGFCAAPGAAAQSNTMTEVNRSIRKRLLHSLLHLRNAVAHPLRLRFVHQVVVEELLHAHLEILLILRAREVMRLARIRQEDHLLSPAPCGAVELEPLVPIDRVVGGAMKNHERRADVAHVEDRRLILVQILRCPWGDAFSHANLADFHDALLKGAGARIGLVVEADEVRRRRTRDDGREDLRPRENVRALISTPTVTLKTDVLRISIS